MKEELDRQGGTRLAVKLNFRVTEAEHAHLLAALRSTDLTVSEAIRHLVRQATSLLALQSPEIEAIAAARRDLAAVGNNLNQLARLGAVGRLHWKAGDAALVRKVAARVNATLAVLDRIAPGGILSPEREAAALSMATRSVAVKMASAEVPISTLSGGNQQKVVIGRWLARGPKLLILDEPTKGIDIGAKAEISQIILRLAEEGTAILLISSEMPEVLALSDRVLVMRSGRITGELTRDNLSAEAVIALATRG